MLKILKLTTLKYLYLALFPICKEHTPILYVSNTIFMHFHFLKASVVTDKKVLQLLYNYKNIEVTIVTKHKPSLSYYLE